MVVSCFSVLAACSIYSKRLETESEEERSCYGLPNEKVRFKWPDAIKVCWLCLDNCSVSIVVAMQGANKIELST